MFRINIWHIVEDHFKSLRLEGKDHIYFGDLIVFVLLPLLVSILLVYYDVTLKPQVGNIIKAMAIFGAFMFNLLAIINGQLSDIRKQVNVISNKNTQRLKSKFIQEIHSNISFNIILSIVVIVFMLIYDLTPLSGSFISEIFVCVTLFLSYFFLLLFFLTLLMVINRVYILIRNDS